MPPLSVGMTCHGLVGIHLSNKRVSVGQANRLFSKVVFQAPAFTLCGAELFAPL